MNEPHDKRIARALVKFLAAVLLFSFDDLQYFVFLQNIVELSNKHLVSIVVVVLSLF